MSSEKPASTTSNPEATVVGWVTRTTRVRILICTNTFKIISVTIVVLRKAFKALVQILSGQEDSPVKQFSLSSLFLIMCPYGIPLPTPPSDTHKWQHSRSPATKPRTKSSLVFGSAATIAMLQSGMAPS